MSDMCSTCGELVSNFGKHKCDPTPTPSGAKTCAFCKKGKKVHYDANGYAVHSVAASGGGSGARCPDTPRKAEHAEDCPDCAKAEPAQPARYLCRFPGCELRVYKDEHGVWRHHASNLRESHAPSLHNAEPLPFRAPAGTQAQCLDCGGTFHPSCPDEGLGYCRQCHPKHAKPTLFRCAKGCGGHYHANPGDLTCLQHGLEMVAVPEPSPATETAREPREIFEDFKAQWSPYRSDYCPKVLPRMMEDWAIFYHAAQSAAERYAPLGDNHHNAAKCPYCNPEYVKLAGKEMDMYHDLGLEQGADGSWHNARAEAAERHNEAQSRTLAAEIAERTKHQILAKDAIAAKEAAERQIAELREKAWKYDDLCR